LVKNLATKLFLKKMILTILILVKMNKMIFFMFFNNESKFILNSIIGEIAPIYNFES